MEPQKPKTLTINLSPTARVVIERIRDDFGVPNTTAMERILEWIASLDKRLLGAVLNRDDDLKIDLLSMALAEMVGAPKGSLPATVEEAATAARLAVDRLESLGKTYRKELKERLPAKQR